MNESLKLNNLAPMTAEESKMLTDFFRKCALDRECNDGPVITTWKEFYVEVCLRAFIAIVRFHTVPNLTPISYRPLAGACHPLAINLFVMWCLAKHPCVRAC